MRIFLLTFLGVLVLLALIYFLIPVNSYPKKQPTKWGVTFSKEYANYLGLDWQAVYLAMLKDLNISSVRLPAYWDELEPEAGHFVFTDLDWQIAKAKEAGKDVVLAIGYKLPRWPECRLPTWFKGTADEFYPLLQNYLLKVLGHYKDETAIFAVQVENEPYFKFGICPIAPDKFYKQEVAFVKQIEKRPIIVTDSGELSFWQKASRSGADILGISVYKVVYNDYFGYFKWFLTSNFYRKKMFFLNSSIKEVYLMELQAELWPVKEIALESLDTQIHSFDVNVMQSNLQLASAMQLPRVYLWGVEWWYLLQDKYAYPAFWQEIKNFLNDK